MIEHAQIFAGYRPGVIGDIASLHARHYASEHGFGQHFESTVAHGLADFAARLSGPRNGLWTTWHNNALTGSIAIDGEDLGDNQAHLRWFITATSERGIGLGKTLLRRALAFCDTQQFESIKLWTFEGLDAARHLYEQHGFVLEEQFTGDQWGRLVREQIFVRSKGVT